MLKQTVCWVEVQVTVRKTQGTNAACVTKFQLKSMGLGK
jgi:hypothetical protein